MRNLLHAELVACRVGCSGKKASGQAFCRSCWFKLPEVLRDHIVELNRRANRSTAHVAALREAITMLRAFDTAAAAAESE